MRFLEELQVEPRLSEAGNVAEAAKPGLSVTIEAIHVGATRNYNRYSSEELKVATPTWISPYGKPVLKHHDRSRGEAIGRVTSASYGPSANGVSECITLEALILDSNAIEKIKDSRYLTVSVGGTAEHVICSICGTDRVQTFCEHMPGQTYEGKTCYYDIKGITFDEISFVNVPADPYAQVIKAGEDSVAQEDGRSKAEQLAQSDVPAVTAETKGGEDPNRPKGKDGEPIGKMKTGNRKQAYYGWAA